MSEDIHEKERITLISPDDSLQLRQLAVEDAEGYLDLLGDDRKRLLYAHLITRKPTLESIRSSILTQDDPSELWFGIWDDEKMVGVNSLTPWGKSAELSSLVGKEFLGHNYAARARKLLIDYAFNTMGVNEIRCRIALGNEASRVSVERNGFTISETLPYQWVYTLKKPAEGDDGSRH